MIHGTHVLFRESIDCCREEQFLIINNNQSFTEQVFNVEQTAVESLESMYMTGDSNKDRETQTQNKTGSRSADRMTRIVLQLRRV